MMLWKPVLLAALAIFWLAAGVLCLLCPARLASPQPEAAGPELPVPQKHRGRRAGAAIFAVLSLVLLLAAWVVLSLELAPAQPVDFYSDAWAAECGSAVSRNTVRRKDRRARTLTVSHGSFTGAATLWRIYTGGGGEEITIVYQIEVKEGQGDLVLVWPDDTVTRLSGETSPYTFTAGAGETRLRLIGDRGKLEFTITIPSRSGQWMDD